MMKILLTKLAPYKLYLYAIVLITTFYGGWYVKSVFVDAAEKKYYETTIKMLQLQNKNDRLLVLEHQNNVDTLRKSYIQLGKELSNAKGKLGKCKSDGSINVTEYGVSLWNDIGKGELSENTTRVPEETSTGGRTLEEVFENRKVNAEICNELREQINSIIKWDKETYGE